MNDIYNPHIEGYAGSGNFVFSGAVIHGAGKRSVAVHVKPDVVLRLARLAALPCCANKDGIKAGHVVWHFHHNEDTPCMAITMNLADLKARLSKVSLDVRTRGRDGSVWAGVHDVIATDPSCGDCPFIVIDDAEWALLRTAAMDLASLLNLVELADALASAADGAGDCALLRATAVDRLRDALVAYREARDR